MTNKTAMKWIGVLAVPAGISGAWFTARVVSAIGAVAFVVQMAIGKIVLIALAATLGAAFAHAAHAQGLTGFVYARDGAGIDRMVMQRAYQEYRRFGNDLYYLGHAYDGGVRAVLYDGRTQVFISYAFTADANNTGKDLVRATLNARNYNANQPAITSVFVAGFGGTLIGSTTGSMFAYAYGQDPWQGTKQPY